MGHSGCGAAWAAASARTLARRLRRVHRRAIGESRAAALAWRAAHWQLADRVGAHAPKFGETIAAARVLGATQLFPPGAILAIDLEAQLAAGAVQISPAPSTGDGEGDGGSGLSASERSLAAEFGGKTGQDELESVDAVWESDVAVEVCVAEPAAEPCHPAGPRARRRSGALPCRSRRTPLRGGAVPYVPLSLRSCVATAESVVEALGCGPLAPADRVGCAPLPPVLGHASAERGASGRASVDGSADASDAGSSRPSTRGPVEYADDVVPHLGGCCVGSDDIVEGPVGGSAIEHAFGMEPLVADSVGCTAGDGHAGSECGFVSFLDDFSVAAVARAAQGPKSGVESLLDWAEARALGVRLGSAGCPDAEARPVSQRGRGHGALLAGWRQRQQAQQDVLDVQLRWAKPQAEKDGWADQPRGRRSQRQARSAATSAATSKSQASASGDSGAPSGSGAAAIERLQVAVEQLEALQAEPPDGVDCCFADVVASQLEALRAELAEAQRAAAEQKASPMPLSTMLHKEANAISKAEKRLRAARQSLEQKQAARGLAEAQLQKAQEELAQLDAEVEEASRAPHVLKEEARAEAAAQLRQRAAEWAGASQVPGLLMQLDKLPEAWGSSNFEVARAAIRSQVEAVRAQLAEAPAVPRRAPWAESRRMGGISSENGDHAGGCRLRTWPLLLLALLAAPLGVAAEARGHGSRARSHASGAKPRQQEGGGAKAARIGGKRPLDLGGAQAPPAPGQAATAAQDVRCGLEEPRLALHRLEEARGAARRMGYTTFPHASAPADKEGPLANSGVVAALRHCLTGVTVSTASGLQLRAGSLHLQGALGPEGFNLDIFAAFGDAVLYQRPQFMSVVGLATESFSTKGAVLAGPLAVARNVVGDIALQAVGTEQLVAARLGSAGLEVARRLLASSPSLGALRRARRLDPIHKDGPTACMACGRTVTGNADGELHRWRFAACRSAGAPPMGAERGLRRRCAELRGGRNLDPAALTAGHAVQMMAGLLQAGELPPRMMERGLEAAATRRARADTPWKHCASPFDAVVLTRARIDWHFKPERCMVTDLGDELDLMHLGSRELGLEAGLGARRASVRRETRKLRHDARLQRPPHWGAIGRLLGPDGGPRVRGQNVLGACISNAHWTQARLLDAGEQGHARCCCCGAERGTLWHRLFGCPVLEAQQRDGVSARLKQRAERARALGERAGDNFGRCWLPPPEPPQGRRTDAMWVQCVCRPADDKLNGKLYLDGSAREPQYSALRCEAWAIAQCDDDGDLVAGVYGTVWRDRCPQQTAKDGEDLAAWMLATLARPAVQKVNIGFSSAVPCLRRGRVYATAPSRANARLWGRILAAFEPGAFEVKKVPAPCSRQAVLDGLLTEAQRRGNEHADRLAEMGAQTHAVDRLTVGVHQALAEIAQELGRWIWWAAIVGQGIEARGREGPPPAAARRQARFAGAEVSQAAENATGEGPMAKRRRLESARSTGSSSAALSASAVAFSILGHALSYACAGEGEGTQELVACSKRGAYMTLGGRSGVRPRDKERCPGDRIDEGGRNQRSLWLRGLHPGGRRQEGSRAARRRAKGEGTPALRSQGPAPEHAQERYLEWLGTAAEPAVDSSTAASSAGNAPAAAAEPQVAAGPGEAPADATVAAAAASRPLRRPAAARAGRLGGFGVTEEELAAAAGAAGDALEDRRVRRRMVRRGGPTVSE
ncbi:unnamed protein product [Prorocentrum cordatum]|uniref:Uncharacterized protein n=1 Tax=Prorocentrum cordatum TaxID=2364126 RepID=A0ABN9QJ20_9DINO|nr:unnamed protein product [Polarella glacialis]